jgi:hypothetical protein
VAAVAVARSCGSHDQEVSKEEAIELATEAAAFTPCAEPGCVVVRALQQGIPPRLVWIVGLAERLDDQGAPISAQNFIVDAATGEIQRVTARS